MAQNGAIKFNTIGLPYNFKKLLKRDDFSGHINYSAPELIMEKVEFTNKVDIWALGCSIYFIIHKGTSGSARKDCSHERK